MSKKILSASDAIAEAVMLCKPKVISAYPITPQTLIVEKLADLTADHVGKGMDTEFVNVESEHSAMSVCIGAEATGARTFTATSSQGLALMSELLYVASGMRLPIVTAVVNRALSAPLNIWGDHSDAMAQRDSGWMQFYVESAQEAYDTIMQAYKISESTSIPAMVCVDGFTLSHVWENVETINDIGNFVPEYNPEQTLLGQAPLTFGAIAYPQYYQQFKEKQHNDMVSSIDTIKKINAEFKDRFGRSYGDGLIEAYRMEDAKSAVLALGSMCTTARAAVDEMRSNGKKIGLIKLKCFRPFPKKEIEKFSKLKGIAVIERAVSPGSSGPVYAEVKSVLPKVQMNNFITGLGGKDITKEMIIKAAGKIGQKNEMEFLE